MFKKRGAVAKQTNHKRREFKPSESELQQKLSDHLQKPTENEDAAAVPTLAEKDAIKSNMRTGNSVISEIPGTRQDGQETLASGKKDSSQIEPESGNLTVKPRPRPKAGEDALHQTRLYDRELNQDLAIWDTTSRSKFAPKMAASNIRSSTVVDYQPNVCKQYKLTGYCGYGDTCKFLHEREDYSAGWQLDLEWQSSQSKSKPPELIEEHPKCAVCQTQDPRNGVSISCGHIYCESCFLEYSRHNSRCAECNKLHHGSAVPI